MKSTTKAPASKAPAAKAALAKPASKAAPKRKTSAAKKTKATEAKDPKAQEETKEEVVDPSIALKAAERKMPMPTHSRVPDKKIEELLYDFRTIDFLKLDTYLTSASLNQKYCLIFDQTGKVPDYMTYKGVHKDIH